MGTLEKAYIEQWLKQENVLFSFPLKHDRNCTNRQREQSSRGRLPSPSEELAWLCWEPPFSWGPSPVESVCSCVNSGWIPVRVLSLESQLSKQSQGQQLAVVLWVRQEVRSDGNQGLSRKMFNCGESQTDDKTDEA